LVSSSGTGSLAHWNPPPHDVQCSVGCGGVDAAEALSPAAPTVMATPASTANVRRHRIG